MAIKSIITRFLAIPLLASVLVGALALLFLVLWRAQENLLNDLVENKLGEYEQLSGFFSDLSNHHVAMFDILLKAGNQLTNEQIYDESTAHIDALYGLASAFGRLKVRYGGDEESKILYDNVGTELEQYRNDVVAAVEVITAHNDTAKRFMVKANARYHSLSTPFMKLLFQIRQGTALRSEAIGQMASRVRIWYLFGSFFTVLTLFLASRWLATWLLGPVFELIQAAKTIRSSSDYSFRVPAVGEGEMSVLVDGFNQMLEHIDEQNHRLLDHGSKLEEIVDKKTSDLKTKEARLRAIIEGATDAIMTISSSGEIHSVNPAFERIFNASQSEACGKPISQFLKLPSAASGQDESATFLNADFKGEVIGIRPEGLSFPVELHVGSVGYDKSTTWIATARDLSERKLIEAQLVQAQKLESIGQLAAGIAHEINTPTQYIGDNLKFLRESFENLSPVLKELASNGEQGSPVDLPYLIEEIPAALQQSLDGISRVTSIVSAMKNFAHPGATEKYAVDINECVRTTATVSTNTWKYVADLELDLESNLPSVVCISNEINQVILNLIVNAAHAVEDAKREGKGLIRVTTGCKEGWVEIAVSDTGCGMPKEVQSRIFDPFFTTKGVGRGTGQGLTLVYNMVTKRHGGYVKFQTEQGKGTTFFVGLPLSPQQADSADSDNSTIHS